MPINFSNRGMDSVLFLQGATAGGLGIAGATMLADHNLLVTGAMIAAIPRLLVFFMIRRPFESS